MTGTKLYCFVIAFISQICFISAGSIPGSFHPVISSPFATGSGPETVVFSPITTSGTLFAAVTNYSAHTLSVYKVDQTTGQCAEVTQVGSPFKTGSEPFALAFSPVTPTGNLFAAVTNYGSTTISIYLVDQATGQFTEVTNVGSPFLQETTSLGIAFSPITTSGKLFLAITNQTCGTISIYLVDQTTGKLQVVSTPISAGKNPAGIAFSPLISGNLFAAVANFNSATISVYMVNQATGMLSEVVGSPFAAGAGPYGIAFSPVTSSGNLFIAVTNEDDVTVSVYAVNQMTGFCTPVTGSPFEARGIPYGIAFSPLIQGKLLSAVTGGVDNRVSVYEVNETTGTFTELAGSPFMTGRYPLSIAFSSLTPVGTLFAALANLGDSSVSVYRVNIEYTFPVATITTHPAVIKAGDLATIHASVTGSSPFHITWSDGFIQTVEGVEVVREVCPTCNTLYEISSISDKNGYMGNASNSVLIAVDMPQITSESVLVPAHSSTPLSSQVETGEIDEVGGSVLEMHVPIQDLIQDQAHIFDSPLDPGINITSLYNEPCDAIDIAIEANPQHLGMLLTDTLSRAIKAKYNLVVSP